MSDEVIETTFPINYDSIPSHTIGARAKRGRIGTEEYGPLFNLVSSKKARDITRKSDWISKAPFNKWSEKHDGYYGEEKDYDNDGIDEFIVRHGDKTGPIIAVNGYTTKASNYPFKARYYNKYPTAEERRETSYREYMNDYYKPKYAKNRMDIESYEVNPNEDELTKAVIAHGGYRTQIPKSLSPYQLFTKITNGIINEMMDLYGKQSNITGREFRRKLAGIEGTNAFAATYCSEVYFSLITYPIHQKLEQNKLMTQYIQIYTEKRKRRDPSFVFDSTNDIITDDFYKWLHARKEYKKAAKELAEQYIDDYDNTTNRITKIVDSLINKAIEEKQ